jgi:hypothetical protein
MQSKRDVAPAANTHLSEDSAAGSGVASLVAIALDLCAPMLAARGQTATMDHQSGAAIVGRRSSPLGALLACAVQEVSGCTIRGGAITCTVLRHAVILRGDNPIIMPEAALSLDWMMLVRAKAVGVKASLQWEQGRGPLLTLALPTGACAPSAQGEPFAGRFLPA